MEIQGWKAIKSNEILKNHFASRWQGYLLSIFALFFLSAVQAEVSFYLFLYLSGFIYAQTFLSENWNWFRKLLVAPLFSTGATVLICALFDATNIPIGIWCIYLVWFGSLLITFLIPFSVKVHALNDQPEYQFEILLAAIFVIGLAARVFPVIHEPAPILHDPEAHAFMAKQIIETGRVERFYSPGLHFNIAMATLTTKVSLARNTLMITQFFNALIAVTSGIFILEFSKRKWWAILAGAIFAVGSHPAAHYTTAGKNALVFNVAFLFLIWAIVWVDMKKTHKIILCNLLLLISILSHYPTAFICCLGLAVMFWFINERRRFVSYVIFAIGLGLLWGGLKLSYQIDKVESSQFKLTHQATLSDVVTSTRIKTEIKSIADFFQQKILLSQRNYEQALWPIGLVTLILLGVQNRKFLFFPIFWFVSFVLIELGRFFQPISPLWIITSEQIITQYIADNMIVVFPIAIVLFEIWEERSQKYWAINTILVLAVVVSGAFSLARRYRDYQEQNRMLQQSDLTAFKWMTEHLDPEDKILVDAIIHQSEVKTVTFAVGSGLWIPVYTDFEISTPFERTGYRDTYANTKLYKKFAGNPNDCHLRSRVLEGGFKYYFHGSRSVFAPPMEVTEEAFELVYDNGPVKIYRILPCPTK